MTSRLNRDTLPDGRLIGASAPQQTGIVHFGLGNFHRAHLAVYTAKALAAEPGDWGIVGIANRSHRVVDAMDAQDHLYSILTLQPGGEEVGVVDVHRRTFVAAEDGPQVLDAIADPAHKILTLTISEAGYHLDGRTNELQTSSPDIAADLAEPENPRSPLGLIARGLVRRFESGGAPITVLSCDNLVSAGNTTRAAVQQFLTVSGAAPEMLAWLGESVTFPNAMVDRIVPAPTDATREAVERILGVVDECPVPAEKFTMWVIEDDFAAGRPAWDAAGAIFTHEVEKYELVKLRLLNGSHSLIAYLGGLDGRGTIPASRAQDFVARCVRAAIEDEYLPSIPLPEGFDAQGYIDSLFDRWNNTALGDKTSRVGSDGSTKLVQRVPEPALRLLRAGQVPQQLALTVAGWICCVVPPTGFEPGPVADAMVEPAKEKLLAATKDATDVRAHVAAIMAAGIFPDELVAQQPFVDRVTEFCEVVVADGVRAAAQLALEASGR
ncbi:mannitol dehydrogenase family protein [Nigerium massiliense]|uniref:mannitol dehydrogenase family protein n=1 Tax=Nigerium massiliense TaxID=1522317 RepID=UPI00058DF732|nr:mannitol dehydrogenase family protein [Nigerium massiliense]